MGFKIQFKTLSVKKLHVDLKLTQIISAIASMWILKFSTNYICHNFCMDFKFNLELSLPQLVCVDFSIQTFLYYQPSYAAYLSSALMPYGVNCFVQQ